MKVIYRIIKMAKDYTGLLVISGISLIAITALNLVVPWVLGTLIDILTGGSFSVESMPRIYHIAMILFIVYLLKVVFRFLASYLPHKAAWNFVSAMRVKTYEHLQKLSLRYYQDKQTGQLMSRVMNDTGTFELLIAHVLPESIANVLILIGVAVMMFLINPMLTLLTLIPVPLILWSAYIFTHYVRPNFRAMQQVTSEVNAVLQDNFSGIKEIQVFNQQERETENVRKKSEKLVHAILRALKLSGIFHPSVELLTSLGTVIVVGFGGYLAATTTTLSAGNIVSFLLYLSLFYAPITNLAKTTEDFQQAFAGAERVLEILETQSDIQDAPDAKTLTSFKGRITAEHVQFAYNKDNEVLNDISFDLEPGKMLALVGPTGVGKSTLISLIARFYDPDEGRILFDGHDIKTLKLHAIRDQISIVLQDIFLFSGTVAENIAYACPEATHENIIQAAKAANIHDEIMAMPSGYETLIGERGVRLSGGQKQRLSIARAILRDTPLLILDEATASVDTETENRIQQAIQNLAGKKTVIVIAHRLSTVKQADMILVVQDGKICESGNHQSLIQAGGLYARLCDKQF